MSATRTPWVSDAQLAGIEAGLRAVDAWASADEDPEGALAWAVRSERDPGGLVVGLATLTRLLAMELAAATGATEVEVLRRLEDRVHRLQHGP